MHSDSRFLDELLAGLQAVGLEAIVVGATAAILQGAPIMTLDVDLLVRDTRLNRSKPKLLASRLGAAPPVPINDVTTVHRITGAAAPIDILFDEMAGGLRFAAVRSRSARIAIGTHQAVVACLEDVIASKEAANRPKDRAVLPILQDTLRVLRSRGVSPDTGSPP